MEFHYPKNKDYFERLLQEFKLRSRTDQSLTKDNNSTNLINRGYGENIKRDCLIVMDGVSGLVETSQKFASFLTVARKLMYHCVYIFHTTHPKTYIWKSILSQTNILNVFPPSILMMMVILVSKNQQGISDVIEKTRHLTNQKAQVANCALIRQFTQISNWSFLRVNFTA